MGQNEHAVERQRIRELFGQVTNLMLSVDGLARSLSDQDAEEKQAIQMKELGWQTTIQSVREIDGDQNATTKDLKEASGLLTTTLHDIRLFLNKNLPRETDSISPYAVSTVSTDNPSTSSSYESNQYQPQRERASSSATNTINTAQTPQHAGNNPQQPTLPKPAGAALEPPLPYLQRWTNDLRARRRRIATASQRTPLEVSALAAKHLQLTRAVRKGSAGGNPLVASRDREQAKLDNLVRGVVIPASGVVGNEIALTNTPMSVALITEDNIAGFGWQDLLRVEKGLDNWEDKINESVDAASRCTNDDEFDKTKDLDLSWVPRGPSVVDGSDIVLTKELKAKKKDILDKLKDSKNNAKILRKLTEKRIKEKRREYKTQQKVLKDVEKDLKKSSDFAVEVLVSKGHPPQKDDALSISTGQLQAIALSTDKVKLEEQLERAHSTMVALYRDALNTYNNTLEGLQSLQKSLDDLQSRRALKKIADATPTQRRGFANNPKRDARLLETFNQEINDKEAEIKALKETLKEDHEALDAVATILSETDSMNHSKITNWYRNQRRGHAHDSSVVAIEADAAVETARAELALLRGSVGKENKLPHKSLLSDEAAFNKYKVDADDQKLVDADTLKAMDYRLEHDKRPFGLHKDAWDNISVLLRLNKEFTNVLQAFDNDIKKANADPSTSPADLRSLSDDRKEAAAKLLVINKRIANTTAFGRYMPSIEGLNRTSGIRGDHLASAGIAGESDASRDGFERSLDQDLRSRKGKAFRRIEKISSHGDMKYEKRSKAPWKLFRAETGVFTFSPGSIDPEDDKAARSAKLTKDTQASVTDLIRAGNDRIVCFGGDGEAGTLEMFAATYAAVQAANEQLKAAGLKEIEFVVRDSQFTTDQAIAKATELGLVGNPDPDFKEGTANIVTLRKDRLAIEKIQQTWKAKGSECVQPKAVALAVKPSAATDPAAEETPAEAVIDPIEETPETPAETPAEAAQLKQASLARRKSMSDFKFPINPQEQAEGASLSSQQQPLATRRNSMSDLQRAQHKPSGSSVAGARLIFDLVGDLKGTLQGAQEAAEFGALGSNNIKLKGSLEARAMFMAIVDFANKTIQQADADNKAQEIQIHEGALRFDDATENQAYQAQKAKLDAVVARSSALRDELSQLNDLQKLNAAPKERPSAAATPNESEQAADGLGNGRLPFVGDEMDGYEEEQPHFSRMSLRPGSTGSSDA